MISSSRCEKCGALRANIKADCSFCGAKKFGSAAKRFFGGLFDDAKEKVNDLTNKVKQVRVKTEE